ncbi:Hint domain-containing protein [Streptomyces noursei]|uniref:Hint domain-containing protein n=1 Tax=Streptomyces noursei TaxID=1971 RepID=UPI00344E6783
MLPRLINKRSSITHTRDVVLPATPTSAPRFVGTATIASAALITRDRVRPVSQAADWQIDAWELYDSVPELRFGIGWIANACSRARLYVGRIDPEGSGSPAPVESTDPNAEPILQPYYELFGGQVGQGEMLRRLATHLNLVGETYICGYDHPEDQERIWQVLNSAEVATSTAGTMQITPPDEPDPVEVDADHAALIRIWRPHPRRNWYPDSPLISLRGACKELLDLSAHISASAESRLAGAGLLFLPDELTFPQPAAGQEINPIHSDPFTAALVEAMMTPLKDRGSASAVVPIVVRGPSEAGNGIKHFSFSTPLDAAAADLRDAATKRIASGLDIPAEILLGIADINHWCVPDSTEILTRVGWRTVETIAAGDHVATLNHTTGETEWQPIEEVNSWDVLAEPMVEIKGDGHHSLTTMAHRWPVRSRHGVPMWVTSEELAASELGYFGLITDTETGAAARSLEERGRFVPTKGQITETVYTGTIWCPTTANRTWLARHEGTVFWTGNSVWALEESSIKIHIEPLLALICDALTYQYLRPSLEALQVPDVENYALWYDVSDLVQQANRPQQALQAYQQGALSERALRQVLGFGEDDAPTKEERNRHVLQSVVATQGLIAPLLLPLLGIDTPDLREYAANQVASSSPVPPKQKQDQARENKSAAAGGGTSGAGGAKAPQKSGRPIEEGAKNRPQPKSKGAPAGGNQNPGARGPGMLALEKAVELAAVRALDKAGGWLLSRQSRPVRAQYRDVPQREVHVHLEPSEEQTDLMLAGAYRDLHLVLPECPCTHELVDVYVRALISEGKPHDPVLLRALMAERGCPEWSALTTQSETDISGPDRSKGVSGIKG